MSCVQVRSIMRKRLLQQCSGDEGWLRTPSNYYHDYSLTSPDQSQSQSQSQSLVFDRGCVTKATKGNHYFSGVGLHFLRLRHLTWRQKLKITGYVSVPPAKVTSLIPPPLDEIPLVWTTCHLFLSWMYCASGHMSRSDTDHWWSMLGFSARSIQIPGPCPSQQPITQSFTGSRPACHRRLIRSTYRWYCSLACEKQPRNDGCSIRRRINVLEWVPLREWEVRLVFQMLYFPYSYSS